jgi:hypothetical protein
VWDAALVADVLGLLVLFGVVLVSPPPRPWQIDAVLVLAGPPMVIGLVLLVPASIRG